MEKMTFINDKQNKLINLLCEKGLSYNQCQKALRNRDVKVNGKRVGDNQIVQSGDEITVYYEKSKKNFKVIYEDENIIIVDKPRMIEIEGEDGLAKIFDALAVHRLDRNTTGLVILAKNIEARDILLECFKNRTITKKYLAYVVGQTHFDGQYEAYLVKDSKNSFVKIYDKPQKNGVKIISIFKTLQNEIDKSLVECTLVTGKTHQLRAHLAFLGHAIIGDGKYGKNIDNKKYKEKYQLLRCYYIKFNKIGGKLNYLKGKEFIVDKKF